MRICSEMFHCSQQDLPVLRLNVKHLRITNTQLTSGLQFHPPCLRLSIHL
jgi:hypothetical protein